MLFDRGRTCIETAALSHGAKFEKLAQVAAYIIKTKVHTERQTYITRKGGKDMSTLPSLATRTITMNWIN